MSMTEQERLDLDKRVKEVTDRSKKFNNAVDNIFSVADILDSLAANFYATGNVIVCDRLAKLSGSLKENVKIISDTSHQEATERYQDAQQSTANMLRGMLAVAGCLDDKNPIKPIN